MKETYSSLKNDLIELNKSLSSLLISVKDRTDIAGARFSNWQKACESIHQQITEEVVRVAVIGPVKSGKSTLINSLFRGDYLKRGAGVLTSIVTRIRSGEHIRAVLFFKSWEEVNADIEQALVMLPTWDQKGEDGHFDIRLEQNRKTLSTALERLSDDLVIRDGVRDANIVLLSLYLKGFDQVRGIISSDSMTEEFRDERFSEHQTYVGNDELSVYLKDIELEINSDYLDRSIEIADCQGSDSPNPLHLAMIQDYLLRTHFIIYVVSSRIGLRQADIRFLSIIKKMGILDNILFVVNNDFSEHESTEELEKLVDKVKEELALLRPEPDVYTFSALFNLFSSLSVDLTKRDNLRLSQWMAEEDLAASSNRETERFQSALNDKLTQERFGLLLRNHLERMSVIVSGVERWASMNREILEKDADGAAAMITKVEHHHERMEQIKSLIKSTLSGAQERIMKELRTDIDRFFNVHSGGMINQTIAYVREYSVATEKYRTKLSTSGFSNTLYLVFQEFKRALDTFIAETIDPEIARFVREVENRIRKHMDSVSIPYYSMASEDIAELKASISSPDEKISQSRNVQGLLDLDALKQSTGLTIPSSSTAIRYSAKLKTEAMVRLGFYSVRNLFKKALKKAPENEKDEHVRALADGVKIIKSETEDSLVFHFENYRENFKFQYVAKLIEAASEYLYALLMERYETYNTDIKALETVIEKKGGNREYMIHFLNGTGENLRTLHNSIDGIRDRLAVKE
jgi:GTPase SAR1 family protein